MISKNIKNNIDSLANSDVLLTTDEDFQGMKFTPGYIDTVFSMWYSAGKPSMTRLKKMLPNPSDFGIMAGYPSKSLLDVWYEKFFKEKAEILDAEVSRIMSGNLIAEKVAMLDAHTVVATEMQEMALNYLRENKEKLNPSSAVRLLVEGVRIERESRGIPRTLEKLADKSDEDLMAQLEDYLLRSPIKTEVIEEIEDDSA